MLVDAAVRQVEVPPGAPLGIGPSRYEQVTVRVEPGATLFCFTDGLVERRGEDIDTGLARLATTLADGRGLPVADLVDETVSTLRNDDAADDIAALAIHWTGAR
jgi:serine phosphatase RsbU (regulator of sigma subunit)